MEKKPKTTKEKERYVIVRTYAMGVFAGTLDPSSTESLKILCNARRLWQWSGAASLSQLSQEGVKNPGGCKFPVEVPRVELTSPNGFEVLDVSEAARVNIAAVPVWKL